MENYHSLIENLNKKGLLNNLKNTTSSSENIFMNNENSSVEMGLDVKKSELRPVNPLESKYINGLDTDILQNSWIKKIDNKLDKLKIQIAQLSIELDEHKKMRKSAYLKVDKEQYDKILGQENQLKQKIEALSLKYKRQRILSLVINFSAKTFKYFMDKISLYHRTFK